MCAYDRSQLASGVYQPPLAWQFQSQNYVCPYENEGIFLFLPFHLIPDCSH